MSICFSACGIFSTQCSNVTNGIISFSLNCKSYVTSSCGFYLRTTSLLSSKCVLINPAQTLLYHLRLLHTVTEWEGKPDSALFSLNLHWCPGPSAGHVQGPCHLTQSPFQSHFHIIFQLVFLLILLNTTQSLSTDMACNPTAPVDAKNKDILGLP